MRKSPLVIYLCCFQLGASGLADTITLANGEKLEGKIIVETPDEITVSIKVSAAITDERTVRRAEIQGIKTTTPDEIAYAQIKNLKPDPLTAQASSIEQAISTLKSFQEKFPQSPYKAAVQASLDLFQKEKEHMAAGEVKFYDSWITKEEAGKRSLQIQAQALIPAMKGLIAQGDLIGALNTFDRLEKTCSATRAYPLAIPLATQILPALLQQADHSMEKLKYDTDAWMNGPDSQSPEIIAARKAEQEKYSALLAQVQKNQIKWPPLLPRSDKGLDALRKLILTENVRLAALPLDKMSAALQRVDKAREAIDANDTATAKSLLTEVGALWPQNEDTTWLQKLLADRKAGETKIATATAKSTQTPRPTQGGTAHLTRSASAPSPVVAPPPATGDSQNSALSFFFTIPGALTVVGGAVLALGLAAFLQKTKKPKDGVVL